MKRPLSISIAIFSVFIWAAFSCSSAHAQEITGTQTFTYCLGPLVADNQTGYSTDWIAQNMAQFSYTRPYTIVGFILTASAAGSEAEIHSNQLEGMNQVVPGLTEQMMWWTGNRPNPGTECWATDDGYEVLGDDLTPAQICNLVNPGASMRAHTIHGFTSAGTLVTQQWQCRVAGEAGGSCTVSDQRTIELCPTTIPNCGVIRDPDMIMNPPLSPWIPAGLNETHQGSEWQLVDVSSIHQTIVLTAGVHTLSIRARAGSAYQTSWLKVQLGTYATAVEVTSPDLRQYDVILQSDGESRDLILSTDTGPGVFIDHVCTNPGTACPMPCGMGTYDADVSHQYLQNSEMYGIEYPPGLWSVNCSAGVAYPAGVGIACSTHKADTGLNAFNWNGSGINIDVSGVKRWSGAGVCGQAVGLMPPPLQNGTSQVLNMRLDEPYNVALRMKRDYGNSRLTVCGQTIDSTPVGEWTDASFYCSDGRNDVTLLADCTSGGCISHYQGPNVGDYSAVEVDDVYIVPGGEISCTAPITVVPTLNCINQNPHLIGLSSRSEMKNGAPQTGAEEGWDLSNARMGSVAAGEFAHKARLWLSNGDTLIHQYVAAKTGSIADGDFIVPGRSYSITVSAKRYGDNDTTVDVAVGSQSPGEQTWNFHLDGANTSTIWSHGFVATADMLNGDNVGIRVSNSGESVLLDSVCISTGGPAITPTQCVGTWLSSSGGNPYDGPTQAEDYIYNVIDLDGNYRLDIAGVADSGGSLDVLYHWDVASPEEGGEHSDISSIAVGAGAFTATVTFPTGYSSGQLRIVTHQITTFTSVCLSKYDAPGGDGPAPLPECGSVSSHIRNSLFYMMSPYSLTLGYTGTAPYYAAELTYNYAIYPLVCTTVSIANWQYDAYNKMVKSFSDYYQQIIDVLWAIYNKLGQGAGSGFDWLSLLWQLFLMLLKLLLKLLELVYKVFAMVLNTIADVSYRSKNGAATMYPVNCTGDAKWMCLGLASIIAMDNYGGNWIRIIVLLTLGCLTVGFIFWLSGQIRALVQPGDTKSNG